MSKFCLTIFEILNELYTAVGAGVVGIGLLLDHGFRSNQILRTLTVATISAGSLLYVFQDAEKRKPSKRQVVFVTGCDAGVGYSFALHANQIGFTVIAGHLSLESKGAKEIRRIYGTQIKQVELDLTQLESTLAAASAIEDFFESEPTHELYAFVNNAAVMVFGEFEWLTDRLIQEQVEVNLTGTFRITKAVIPLLRKYKGRLINVTSHCSMACLPGLAVYGATKTALAAFNDALRIELGKFGVRVINLVPGALVTQTNIMAKHPEHVQDMHREFTQEQHRFYGDYFQRYNAHLLALPVSKMPQKVDNKQLYDAFEDTLLNEHPKLCYVVEPWRYKIYHFLFKWTPTRIRDKSHQSAPPQQQQHQDSSSHQQERQNDYGVVPAQQQQQQQQQLTRTHPEKAHTRGIPTLIPPDDAVNFSKICPPPPPPDNRPELWELRFNSWLGWSWVKKDRRKNKNTSLCCGTEPEDVPDDEVYKPKVSLLSHTYNMPQTVSVPVTQQPPPQSSGQPGTSSPSTHHQQQGHKMPFLPNQARPHPVPQPIQSDHQQEEYGPTPKIIDDCRCPVPKMEEKRSNSSCEIPDQFSDESLCCPCPKCGKNLPPGCTCCPGLRMGFKPTGEEEPRQRALGRMSVARKEAAKGPTIHPTAKQTPALSTKIGSSQTAPCKKPSSKCCQIDMKPSNGGSCTCVCPKCGQCLSPTVELHILKSRGRQKSEKSSRLLQESFSDDSCVCSSVKYSKNASLKSAMSRGKSRSKHPLKQKTSSKCCQCPPEKPSEESLCCCCTCNCPKCAQLHTLLESSPAKTESVVNNKNDYEECTCESDHTVCPNKETITECPKAVQCAKSCHSVGVLTDQCGDTQATPVQDNNNNNNNKPCCPCTCPNVIASPPCYLCPLILPVQQAQTLCANCCQPSLLNNTNQNNNDSQQSNRPIRDNFTEHELRTTNFDTQTELLRKENRGTRISFTEKPRTSVNTAQTDQLATENKQTKTSFVTPQCMSKSVSPIQLSQTSSNPGKTQIVKVRVDTAKPKQSQQQQNSTCVQTCRKLQQMSALRDKPTECPCVKRKVTCACPLSNNKKNNNDDGSNYKQHPSNRICCKKKTQEDPSQDLPNSCVCLKNSRGICKCCPSATAPVAHNDNGRRMERVVNSCFLDVSKPFEDNIDLMNTGLSLFRKRQQPIDILLRNNINITKLITNGGLILSNKKDFRASNFLSSKEKFDFLADQGTDCGSYRRGYTEHSKFLTAICDALLDNRKNKKSFENIMGGDCGSHYLENFLDSGSGDIEDYILPQHQPTKLKETVYEDVATQGINLTIKESQQQNQETVGIQTQSKKLQNIAVQIRQMTAGKLVQTAPKRPPNPTFKIVNNGKISGPRLGIGTGNNNINNGSNKKENSSSVRTKKSRSFLSGAPEMTRTGIYCALNKSRKGQKRTMVESNHNSQDQPRDHVLNSGRPKSNNCEQPKVCGEASQVKSPRSPAREISCSLQGKTTADYIEVVEKLLGSVDLKNAAAPHNLDSVKTSEEIDSCFACALSKIDSEPAKFDSDAAEKMSEKRMLDATTPPSFHESE